MHLFFTAYHSCLYVRMRNLRYFVRLNVSVYYTLRSIDYNYIFSCKNATCRLIYNLEIVQTQL